DPVDLVAAWAPAGSARRGDSEASGYALSVHPRWRCLQHVDSASPRILLLRSRCVLAAAAGLVIAAARVGIAAARLAIAAARLAITVARLAIAATRVPIAAALDGAAAERSTDPYPACRVLSA